MIQLLTILILSVSCSAEDEIRDLFVDEENRDTVLATQNTASSGETSNETSEEENTQNETQTENSDPPSIKATKHPDSYENTFISGYPLVWSGVTHYKAEGIGLVSGSVVSDSAPELKAATVYLNVGGYNCSGTLIGPKTVITAAHCVAENGNVRMTSSNSRVGFGGSKSDMTYIDVESYQLHPGYDYSGGFYPLDADDKCADYAVLTLKQNAPETAIPISFLPSTVSPALEYRAILAGWGIDETGSFASKLISGETNLNFIDQPAGTLFYGDSVSTGLANGDSGGPMYYISDGLMYLLAVNSATYTYGDGSVEDFSCDVRHAVPWLDSL